MGTAPNLSDVDSFARCPEGGWNFFIKFHKENEEKGRVTFILSEIGGQGDAFCSFPTDPEDQFAWTLKQFVEAAGMPVGGGWRWENIDDKKVYGYVTHSKDFANVRNFEPFDGDQVPVSKPISSEGEPF